MADKIQAILKATDTASLKTACCDFTTQFLDCFTLLDQDTTQKVTESLKMALVDKILATIDTLSKNEILDESAFVFSVLRILLREKKGLPDKLFTVSFFESLMHLTCCMDTDASTKARFSQSDQKEIRSSLYKCMINILYYEPSLNTLLANKDTIDCLMTMLLSSNQESKADSSASVSNDPSDESKTDSACGNEIHFLALRLLFYATLSPTGQSLAHQGDHVISLQAAFLHLMPLYRAANPNAIYIKTVCEYLKVFYNLTLTGSVFDIWNDFPDDIYHDHLNMTGVSLPRHTKWELKKLFASLLGILNPHVMARFPTLLDSDRIDLQGYAIQVMLNFSIRFQLLYYKLVATQTLSSVACLQDVKSGPSDHMGPDETLDDLEYVPGSPPAVLYSLSTTDNQLAFPVLAWILDFIDYCLEHDQTDQSFVPVALVFLTRFALVDPNSRRSMRRFVLPSSFDRTILPEHSPCLKGRLVRAMTSSNKLLKESVDEFLFVLCQQNAARLVYHTGYGNAAGLLFKKNLLTGDAKQMPATQLHAHLLPKATASKSTKKEAPEDVSSDEEPARHFLHVAREDEHVNPITGAQEKNTTAADTMTMEEKEQETERLLDLFHRMEKNGMIQVVQSFPE